MIRLPSFFKKAWLRFSLFEKILCIFFIAGIIIGLVFLLNTLVLKYTEEIPKSGGTLKLGLICRPSLVNPIYVSTNECDRDLVELIFDGLFAVDGNGGLVPRLADKVEISDDLKTYTVFLKNNLFWHDGVPLTSEDVIFTIEAIQNPKVKSPLRLNWEGVVAEPISNSVIRFNLKNPYGPFLNNLTLKILPEHIFKNIEPENFALAEYNLKPIGSGPYLFESLEKDKSGKILSYWLVVNEDYYLKPAMINNLIFNFYDSYEKAKESFLKQEIEGFSPVALEDFDFFKNKKGVNLKKMIIPGYYAVFYNLKNPLFTLEVRQALDLLVDRNELTAVVLKNQTFPLNNIFLPPFSLSKEENQSSFSLEKAKEILNKLNYSEENPLKFKLYIPQSPEMINVSNFLINSFKKASVEIEPVIVEAEKLAQEIIDTRSYEALLFGEIIGQGADIYSFWHSSQINSPGLNLSLYENKNLDQLIEENRLIVDAQKKQENFNKIKEIFEKDKPAIFLYNTYYLYLLPAKIKGSNINLANFPSERFTDISNWYIYTQRKFR